MRTIIKSFILSVLISSSYAQVSNDLTQSYYVVGLTNFDSTTYSFYKIVLDSMIKKDQNKTVLAFEISLAEMFKLKHGSENPNHKHIYSDKQNDIYTFIQLVLEDSTNYWIEGNEAIANKTHFTFFNSIYPTLFDTTFLNHLNGFWFNKTPIQLTDLEKVNIIRKIDAFVLDPWDNYVIKNSLEKLIDNLVNDKNEKKPKNDTRYVFLTGYNFLEYYLKYNINNLILLDVKNSPSFFDGNTYVKSKKNKFHKKGDQIHSCKEFIGVFNYKKFKKYQINIPSSIVVM